MAATDHMRRTSLYVGDLHPAVTEKDLTETFAPIGPLLSVHLCRDKFSGNSLCYAFVNYWLPCHALTALNCLNHTPLKGKSMRIMSYERDPTARKNGGGNLFVKNLDQSITSSTLQAIFSKYGTILSCKVAEENGISKGFGFVQFDSEDSAMKGLNGLHNTELKGKKLYVTKFQRKSERKGADYGSVFRELTDGSNNRFMEPKGSKLFVKNLDASVDDKKLEELFSTYGKVISANVIRAGGVSRGFGFVLFSTPDDANKALISLSGAILEGRTLHVALAWPKRQETRNSSSNPFEQQIPLYRNFVIPYNSSNLVQAQNFRGSFYALPMNLATLTACGQGNYLEMSKGELLQRKIIYRDKKELCKGLGATKTFCFGSFPEIDKTRTGGYMLQKIQTIQTGKVNGQQMYLEVWKGENRSTTLEEKLINGDWIHGKEVCSGSESCPEISKMPCPLVQNLQIH